MVFGLFSKDAPVDPNEPGAVVKRVRTGMRAKNYQPPMLPAVASQLMELTSDPNVDLQKVKRLLEQDAMLAAKVLRVAKSSYYDRTGVVRSLDDALTRLGLRTLTELFVQAAVNAKVFRVPGYEAPMDALRQHSTVTAHLARTVAKQTSVSPEYAFLCGLLHDIGYAAALLLIADVPKGATAPAFASIQTEVERVHEEAAATLAEVWQLPAHVALVLESHHDANVGDKWNPLAAVVCVADWLATESGAGIGNEVNPDTALEACEALHLPQSKLDDFRLIADELGVEVA